MSVARTRTNSPTAGLLPRSGARWNAAAWSRALPFMLVAAAGLAGFAWMAILGLRKADGLATSAFDQAYFQQLVWSIGSGRGFHSSFNPGDFLGLHFSPLLVVPAVVEVAWSDARVLTLLQAAALGASAPAAFLFLRAVLGRARRASWLAAALAAPLPIWPIMQQQIRADFHTEALALPLVLLAGWAGLTRRSALMFCAAAVALLAKEDQVYPVAVIGLLVAARAPGRLRARPRRAGLLLVGAAVAWGVAVFGIVKPLFRAGVTYDTDSYYAWLGGGLGVLRVPFERTDELIAVLSRPAGWIVALWLVLGLGGLGFLRPRWLLLLVPPLIVHLLSSQIPQQQIVLQYGLLLVVPALVGAGLGGRRLLTIFAAWRRRGRRRPATPDATGRSATAPGPRRKGRVWPLVLFVVPALVAAVQAGAVPPFSDVQRGFWERPAAIDRLRAVAALAPDDAVLSVDWGLASAVASRPHLEVLPFDAAGAYILVDRQPFVTGRFPWTDRAAFIARIESSDRPLLRDDGRFRLWGPLGE